MINLLYHFTEKSAENHPEKAAIISSNGTLTFSDIDVQSNKVRNYLHNIGIRRGDRVAILLGNTSDVAIAFWGILKAGAVAVPLGAELKADKLEYILNDSGALALFSRMEIIKNSGLDFYASTSLKKIVLSESNEEELPTDEFFVGMNKAIQCEVPSVNSISPLSVDLCSIIYTSGSTGEPKGVMLTHQNMVAATNSLNSYLQYSQDDRVLCALPLTFDYGLYQMIMCASKGATLLLEKEFTWPIFLLKKITSHKATIFPIVPTMLSMVHQQAQKKKLDLSSIRAITNTGAALTRDNIAMSKELFPDAQIFSMYGLTECKRCTYLPTHEIDTKPDSVGIAIPNTELWLIDDEGNRISEPNVVGQLIIRGATVMKGYWNKPEKTAEKLRDGHIPGEKVLHTGDYCFLDKDGYLYFQGRMDNVIKSRGIKVSPKEVEDVILQIPEVHSCCIVGVPHDQYGEALFAFVTLKNGAIKNQNDILTMCSDQLEAYKVPETVEVISEMPRTPNGKFNKIYLKERALELVSTKGEPKEAVNGIS